MQSYQDIPDTTTLTASRSLLLNNILTALSQSSGTAFPTTNLVLGMACYRTDLNKGYVLTNLTGPVWTLDVDYTKTVAYLDSTVAAASRLATARTLSISGDMTGSVSFDGTANVAIAGTLANSGVAAGTYAAATITVDAKGRVTSASATTSLVNTFNSRTGAVTLSSADVTGALGFTPFGASSTINRVRTDNINQGSYGSISISGTNNGYAGVNFSDVSTTYMTSQTSSAHGLYKNNSSWLYYADNSGNFQTGAYGWLHNYFFSTVTNCSKMTENCGSRTGNCDNSANCLTVVANCGNVSQYVTVLEDGGSNMRVNGYKYNFNCNCNCACSMTCCFPLDTLLTLADGTKKRVAEFQAGDKVLTAFGDTANVLEPIVCDVKAGEITVTINGSIRMTREHLLRGVNGWLAVDKAFYATWLAEKRVEMPDIGVDVSSLHELQVGDQIQTESGWMTVHTIERIAGEAAETLMSIELDGDRTFFANGFAVESKTSKE